LSATLLELENIVGGYGDVRVVHGISLSVRDGSVTALVGGNGAGKTTLMLMVAGIVETRKGRIGLSGKDVTDWASHRRVDAGIVLVPEGRWVFPNLTVESNLRLGGIAPRARSAASGRLGEVYDLFPRLGERRRQLAGSLSGGEQQMLAIGRGLMAGPRLLLLDEPTLGLSPIMVKHMFETIGRLNRNGLTILIAEQDVRHVLEAADFAYVVENGSIAMAGEGPALAANPRVREAYLGL
jgi:branched-chain amino acid transport system ATP-binding protein